MAAKEPMKLLKVHYGAFFAIHESEFDWSLAVLQGVEVVEGSKFPFIQYVADSGKP